MVSATMTVQRQHSSKIHLPVAGDALLIPQCLYAPKLASYAPLVLCNGITYHHDMVTYFTVPTSPSASSPKGSFL